MNVMSNSEIRVNVEKVFKNMLGDGTSSWWTDTMNDSARVALEYADWLTVQNDLDELAALEMPADDKEEEIEDTECITLFSLTTRGCDAGGYPDADGGFIVFAGSIASPDTTRRFATRHPGSFTMRQELINEGRMVEDTDTGLMMTTQDLWFETPAMAASILAGQILGADAWRAYEANDVEAF